MTATITLSPIITPRPVTLPVRLPNQDLVRLGELARKPSYLWTSAEALEWLELRHREDARCDALIRAADLAHDQATEARAYPANLSLHDS